MIHYLYSKDGFTYGHSIQYKMLLFIYIYVDLLKLKAYKLFENSDAELSWLLFFKEVNLYLYKSLIINCQEILCHVALEVLWVHYLNKFVTLYAIPTYNHPWNTVFEKIVGQKEKMLVTSRWVSATLS